MTDTNIAALEQEFESQRETAAALLAKYSAVCELRLLTAEETGAIEMAIAAAKKARTRAVLADLSIQELVEHVGQRMTDLIRDNPEQRDARMHCESMMAWLEWQVAPPTPQRN